MTAHSAFLNTLHQEAVEFLRMGLDLFYSSQESKVRLVDQLVNNSKLNSPVLANSLLGRQGLADDHIVAGFIPHPVVPVDPVIVLPKVFP